MYPTRDTSRKGAAKVKQEEEAATRIIVNEELKKYGRKERGHEVEKSQTRPKQR